jgi:hypothetical protein
VIHDCCFERHLLARGTTAYDTEQRFSVTFTDGFRIGNAVLERGRGGGGAGQKNDKGSGYYGARKGAASSLVDANDEVRG